MNERLLPLRERLHERLGTSAWIAPYSQTGSLAETPEETELRCLHAVRESGQLLCILDGTYGTPWGIGQISVLEMELFSAILAGRPIRVLALAPYKADPMLAGLLHAIRAASPTVGEVREVGEADVISIAERMVDGLDGEEGCGTGSILGRFVVELARMRASFRGAGAPTLDVEFLDRRFVPIGVESGGPPDPQRVEALLAEARRATDEPTRLANCWKAIRHLSSAPYDDTNYREYLPLWDETLGEWASAAAWYGLHGHLVAGRLAAVNTLVRLREALGPVASPSIHGTRGAIASEYYSIAQSVRSLPWRHRLLGCALWNVDQALSHSPQDRSGLHAIRGSVLLRMGRVWAAVDEYEQTLALRQGARESPARIGEAQSELGMGYFLTGHWWKAGDMMRRGVANLQEGDALEMTVRALRKLSMFYEWTGRRARARDELEKAYEIAMHGEIAGQLRQIRPCLARLRRCDPEDL